MPKLSDPMRHVLTIICATVAYSFIAYLILRPMEWRNHLLRLFVRSFNAFTAMQSSNGPGWTISVIGSSLFTIIFTLVLVGAFRGREAMQRHWVETGAIALLALIGQIALLYGPIYLRSFTRVVYEDHQDLVARANAPKPACPTCPSCSICPPTKVVEKLIPPSCRLSAHFGMPNSTLKDAVTASAAIIHCNYKIEAPFRVTVEFDSDFIPGAMTLNDSGTWSGGGEQKQGRECISEVSYPSLLSEQLVVVTVYGSTDQYPRPLKAKVESLR